ncbi:hypothetical protein Pcinc_036533 [Petrolisthes cinctipes]|uniref:Uncharacterized protein n=1 Tax=Petrolisthes cinctipes TaxID=88211 RepID=A0AAE1BUC0_PETCI|nr:hypothetical protein Pcinc_036533 [Petrolisthes cinctipes]
MPVTTTRGHLRLHHGGLPPTCPASSLLGYLPRALPLPYSLPRALPLRYSLPRALTLPYSLPRSLPLPYSLPRAPHHNTTHTSSSMIDTMHMLPVLSRVAGAAHPGVCFPV